MVTTGSVSAQFQTYFSKALLERALPLLQMEQFAMKVLPHQNGREQNYSVLPIR